jgi:hypothetical protein
MELTCFRRFLLGGWELSRSESLSSCMKWMWVAWLVALLFLGLIAAFLTTLSRLFLACSALAYKQGEAAFTKNSTLTTS